MGLADRPLTDEDLAHMRREAEELHAAKAAHRQAVEARRIGTAALATEGMEAWSRFGDDPRGGVIVDITETRDRETGEIVRIYVVLNPYEHVSRWEHHLPETEVTEGGYQASTTSRLVNIARRLHAELGKGGNVATPRDERHARWAHRLLVIAMGGGR